MAAVLRPCVAIARPELSARERRKQRNERRSELAESKRAVKEQIQVNSDLSKKKQTSDASVTKLPELGPQWYVLRVWKGREEQTAESLRSRFQSADVEVLCPVVPQERLYKEKPRICMVPFFPGHVFLKCVLDINMYRAVLEEPDVFSFSTLSHKLKEGYDPKLMRGGYSDRKVPLPFPAFQLKILLEQAKKVERDFALSQTKEEVAMPSELRDKETVSLLEPEPQTVAESETEQMRQVGEEVFIVSGPYQNFGGRILELLPNGQVKVSVHVFGTETEVQVHASELS